MSVLSWGKPKIEFGLLGDGDTLPTVWKEMPEIVEDTSKLIPTKGEKREATGEGGEVIDIRHKRNKYLFECEVFVKKGDVKPIADNDGIVTGKYAVRLTPEDDTLEGFIMEKTTVSAEETWSSADGKRWKYSFDGLKPSSGNILKPYTKTP